MKKYKLIKEYPGSATLGTIAYNYNGQCNFEPTNSGKYYSSFQIPFEKYPEFWEEIKEKDYEILSFRDRITKLIFRSSSNVEEGYLSKLNLYNIFSVKRLFDGEIFTIGDEVTYKENKDKWIIKSLSINSDGDYMMAAAGGLSEPWCSISNKGFKKSKQKLFTTEDGVDIFEDNEYYQVTKSFNINKYSPANICSGKALNSLYFSTKEKAEQYILENKPCLSMIDCLMWATSKEEARSHLDLDKLKSLIKSK